MPKKLDVKLHFKEMPKRLNVKVGHGSQCDPEFVFGMCQNFSFILIFI